MSKKVSYEEFYEKYKNVGFKLNYYYKFSFNFHGRLGSENVTVNVGGNANDVYKDYIEADEIYTLEQLQPYQGISETLQFYEYY